MAVKIDVTVFVKEHRALGKYDKVLQSRKWHESAVTARRNLAPILMLSPCPAQPIASSLGVRLYLWEVHWAVGPKAWAQDPPLLRANYMTV